MNNFLPQKPLIPFWVILLCTTSLFGSHFLGGHIETECVSGCTTRVKAYFLRDCSGAAMVTNPNIFIDGNTTGCPAPVQLGSWTPISGPVEITPICPTVSSRCSSSSGTINGVEEYGWYCDFDFCGATCTAYTIHYNNCCRNSALISPIGMQNIWVGSAISTGVGCNSSPVFEAPRSMYIAQGQPMTISLAGTDPDGDSLSYELGPCFQSLGNPTTYPTTATPTQPLGSSWDVQLDSVTGDLDLVPMPGNIVAAGVCVGITEWRNGVAIGSTYRELQFFVVPTPNNSIPVISSPMIVGGAVAAGNDSVICAPGSTVSFELGATDADVPVQTVTMTWANLPAGATVTDQSGTPVSSLTGPAPIARTTFTPPTAGTYLFRYYVEDNACPILGKTMQTIQLVVTNNAPPVPLSVVASALPLNGCNSFALAGTATGGTPPYTYTWSGAGGLSNTSAAFAHTYTQPGTFPVQLTVSDGAGGSVSWFDTLSAGNFLHGTISTSTAAPLANQNVFLVRYNPVDSSLLAIDTTQTDASGFYSFCTLDSFVYVKAAPDSMSYPYEMPTYADTAIVWQDAAGFMLNGFDSVQVDFSTRFGSNPGGPGFVGGLIINGANKQNDPVVGLELWLIDQTGSPLGMGRTNADGYFSFSNIPLGSYQIWVNAPHIENGSAPLIVLAQGNEFQDSLLFQLNSTNLEQIIQTSIWQDELPNWTVAPNPVENQLFLKGWFPEAGPLKVKVLDLQGREMADWETVLSGKGSFSWQTDAALLPPGVYFVKIEFEGRVSTRKIIKK